MLELPYQSQTVKINSDAFDVEYNINSLGYRGSDFYLKADVLALGCSQTYGQGMNEESIWPTLLSKKLNLSISNLASRGDSIVGQVSKAFYYFAKFGNPKIIVAVFPINRILTPYVEGKMEASNNFRKREFDKSNLLPHVEYSEIVNQFDKYAKAPYDPSKIFTWEFTFLYEKIFIDILRQYCKSNGIKLFWTVWEQKYQEIFYKNINVFYPDHHEEYCYMESFNCKIPGTNEDDRYLEYNALDCHQEDRSNPMFYRAADRMDDMLPHWGMHRHVHVAEDFYRYIKQSN